ncbi:hypothetical protein [Vagococcus sp.]|uniref:hypothetical protein n=1 Tax=Vagococcus sp. TaxID=1933889 RepID=UPI003F981B08
MFDNSMIEKYIKLPQTIMMLHNQKELLDVEFYSQNMATRTEYTQLGIVARAFSIEKKVIERDMALNVLNNRIERHSIRLRYFK